MPLSDKEMELVKNYRKADSSNKKAIYWYVALAAKAKNQREKQNRRERIWPI